MKYVALILSFILFSQSLTVCAPAIVSMPSACHVTDQPSNNLKQSCCKKSKHDSKHEKKHEKKKCCDDGCTCLCCTHIAFEQFKIISLSLQLVDLEFMEDASSSQFFHTFEYQNPIKSPPKF